MTTSQPQSSQSNSVLAQLDLAITLSETALSAPDRNSARRSMVLARQVLDGVEHSVLNCERNAEIEIRLDRIQSLLRQYNGSSGLPENKSMDAYPCGNHEPERHVETLPKDEPIDVREPLAAKDARGDTAEALNYRPDPKTRAQREQASWRSLLLGILNKSWAWLMSSARQSGSPRAGRSSMSKESVRENFLDRLQQAYHDTAQKLRILTIQTCRDVERYLSRRSAGSRT